MEKYEVAAFPTFILFKDGKKVDTKSGRFDEESMKKFIKDKMWNFK